MLEGKKYYDPHRGVPVVLTPNGQVVESKMVAGPDGFQVGVFSDGTRFPTEVPNLELLQSGGPDNKAKAKGKGKAKAKAKGKSKPKAEPAQEAQPAEVAADPADSWALKDGKTIPREFRFKFRPAGCSKCRKVPGCTPSCWKGRTSTHLGVYRDGRLSLS